MMKLLFPVLMLVLGLGGGVAAGIFTRGPATDKVTMANGEPEKPANDTTGAKEDPLSGAGKARDASVGPVEFLNMKNQFIIPLVEDGTVHGIVVTTISLEVVEGTIAAVNLLQPKLRDQFLQVLFNHANNGGFDGNFTDFRYLKSLKDELLRNAQVIAGRDVTDVLILDLVRQDP